MYSRSWMNCSNRSKAPPANSQFRGGPCNPCIFSRLWSIAASQAVGCGFDPRLPLQALTSHPLFRKSDFACPLENFKKHRFGQLASIRVLQRGMVTGEQCLSIGQGVFCAMREFHLSAPGELPCSPKMLKHTIEANLAQAYDHAQILEDGYLLVEKWRAVRELVGKRFIGGRRTAHDRGNLHSCEFHSVIAADSIWLRGEARVVEHRIQEIARAVAGEGPAGAIRSMCARGEADDQDFGVGIAEGGDGASPVFPAGICPALGSRHLLAVLPQPHASIASNDARIQRIERHFSSF